MNKAPLYIPRHLGFSLLELVLAMALVAILSAVALAAYEDYIRESRIQRAIHEIRQIELLLSNLALDDDLPDSLSDIGVDMLDPWGNPYQYLKIQGAGTTAKGKVRKDKNLVPLNTDFDLYSMGEDGKSSTPLTAASSYDDIVRARNGDFVGLGKDY